MKEWTSPDGSIRLINADCLEVLPTLDGIDAVVTDPPYGIGATRMNLGNGHRVVYRGEAHWDDDAPDLSLFLRLEVPTVIWGGNHFSLPPSQRWLVWDKGTGNNDFSDCELAWTNLPGAIRKHFRSWVGANAKERCDADRHHPTQKPIAVMEWCLAFVPAAQTILDPFMGSGTTGVACIRLGRKFIGIEREPKYFDIAVRRIEAELRQPRLFPATEPSPTQTELFA